MLKCEIIPKRMSPYLEMTLLTQIGKLSRDMDRGVYGDCREEGNFDLCTIIEKLHNMMPAHAKTSKTNPGGYTRIDGVRCRVNSIEWKYAEICFYFPA